MKLLGLIVLSILILFPAAIYWFDALFHIYFKLKRYHIGRWSNSAEWEHAALRQAHKWLKHTPTVQVSDNSHYLLLDFLTGRYRSATIQSWQAAGLALGVGDYLTAQGSGKLPSDFIDRFIAENGEWKQDVNRVDYAMLAYAILKNTQDPMHVLPAMKKMISVIASNTCDDGTISYSQGKNSDYRYVDTLGMVCPFLALYGRIYESPESVARSIQQIKTFQEKGMLPGTQIPCHAYNVENGFPVGIYGWGRGTAWYCLGLLDTWKELQEGENRDDLKELLRKAAENYRIFQREDGGFCTILQGGGQYDSSVTAAMAYFYSSCAQIFGEERYQQIYKKCIFKLMTVTMRSGAVDICQGDTHGLGAFSQVYDVMPFAQGMLLRALAADATHSFAH